MLGAKICFEQESKVKFYYDLYAYDDTTFIIQLESDSIPPSYQEASIEDEIEGHSLVGA